MRVVVLFLLAPTLWAGDEAWQRARELLDEAAKTVDGAAPNVRLPAFERLGEADQNFDSGLAEYWLRRAWAATQRVPAERRFAAQARIAQSMAQVNPEAASELLWRLPVHGRQ